MNLHLDLSENDEELSTLLLTGLVQWFAKPDVVASISTQDKYYCDYHSRYKLCLVRDQMGSDAMCKNPQDFILIISVKGYRRNGCLRTHGVADDSHVLRQVIYQVE